MSENRGDSILAEMKELVSVIHSRISHSFLARGKKKIPLLPQPRSLRGGTLKDYQLESLAWLVELSRCGLNGILADDMGLGKTIQAISFLCFEFEETGAKGPHLIVVPKNVLRNWEKEIKAWASEFKAVILPGTEAEREQCLRRHVVGRKFDILIATFQSIQSAKGVLSKIKWKTLIMDEAHSIKNDETQLALCLRKFKAGFTLLMTGTPLSNELKELWSLLNFILPDIFEDDSLFARIEESANTDYEDEEEKIKFQVEVAQRFKQMITPFMMRRCKSECNLGLKQKKEITLFTSLTDLQLTLYRNYLKTKSVYGDPSNTQSAPHVQLSKVCLHPYIFPDIEAPDAPPLGEHLIENSAKLKLLDKLLKKLIPEAHKVLVFSQSVAMLKILEDYCAYRALQYCLIDGSSSLDHRDQAIHRFSTQQDIPIFLISTRAGGIGLNLVAADVVVLYDLDWNPQMDKQAMDRAYRIGQKKNVLVFRLITNNTIEERKLEVQKYKLIWDQLVIQKGGLARVKTSEQKFEKLNLDKIATSGAEQIFKVQQNWDDRAIEDIIKMGEEKDKKKTEEIKKKLDKLAEKYESIDPYEEFKATSSKAISQIEGYQENVIKKKKAIESSRANPRYKYEEGRVQLESKSKPKRVIPAFKLYKSSSRAEELLNLIEEGHEQHRHKYEQEIRALGFYSWTKIDYQNFLRACRDHGSTQIEMIAKAVGNKPKQEVEDYLATFVAQAERNKELAKELLKIRRAEERMAEKERRKALEQQYFEIGEDIINFQPRNRGPIKMNQESARWLIHNSLLQTGVSHEEHATLLDKLLPSTALRIDKTLRSEALRAKVIEQAVSESRPASQTWEKVENRYQALEKRVNELTKSGEKWEKGSEENSNASALTEFKK